MGCNKPIRDAYRRRDGAVTFNRADAWSDLRVTIACGRCQGCRLEKSRQWAVRILHEKTMYEPEECRFITLTYDNKNLPDLGTLQIRDWQNFAKRVRKNLGPFRFYHCGEYGDKRGRPHYHACTFGLRLNDERYAGKTKTGHPSWTSDTLDLTWGKGRTLIGEMTFETAAYVARYVMKKVGGQKKEDGHYDVIDENTGEVLGEKQPEYATMSRGGTGGKGGIGKGWYEKYKRDIYKEGRDEIIINGHKARPPKYYDGQYEIDDPQGHKEMKIKRAIKAQRRAKKNTQDRLDVKERVLIRKEKRYARDTE